ncbi:molybdopterin converting factor subunit 1 [Bacillus sp. Y1]|nr:molybdopterin converting factor subunit 1 [Bacillus sp. Y1]AYA78220.1 molybdopterin converting factor subunit 1 [Bacillus sp. Y1]
MNKVMFFAHLRDAAGEESVSLDLTGKTVAEAKVILSERYGVNLDTVMAAVNEEFAGDEDVLSDGDVVAFIPPVSGDK